MLFIKPHHNNWDVYKDLERKIVPLQALGVKDFLEYN